MIRRPPRSTRTDTLFPYTTLFRSWRRGLLIGVPLAILAWGGYSITHRGSPAPAAPPPPTVTIAAPLERAIDRWDDYAGRFEASKAVEVRPSASGAINGVDFGARRVSTRGPLLFNIGRAPGRARVRQY